MKKTKRKIISGMILAGCTVFMLGTIAVIGKNSESGAIPVSVDYEAEKPVIVLDAGHGECS